MSHMPEKVKEEFLAMIPPTIFFFVALHIVALIRALMVTGGGRDCRARVLRPRLRHRRPSKSSERQAVRSADTARTESRSWTNREPEAPS